jgi:hypothetical protein
MAPSRILRRVALVRTDVSEERIASITKVKRISERGTSVTSTRATRCHNPDDGILQSHRLENLKSYIELTKFAM